MTLVYKERYHIKEQEDTKSHEWSGTVPDMAPLVKRSLSSTTDNRGQMMMTPPPQYERKVITTDFFARVDKPLAGGTAVTRTVGTDVA